MMTEPAYTFKQIDLSKLDLHINRGTDYAETQWESYCSLSRLSREAATKQVKALIVFFEGDACDCPEHRPHRGPNERHRRNN